MGLSAADLKVFLAELKELHPGFSHDCGAYLSSGHPFIRIRCLPILWTPFNKD